MQKKPVPVEQPLYEVVRTGILERLRTGHWQAGDQLPPEPRLAEAFGVGIGTVRRAVDELVNERLLHRRAGRGTTVATITEEHAFGLFFSFVDANDAPVQIAARMLAYKRERATADMAARLGLERGAKLARVDNLRADGEVPVMLDRLWIPLDKFPGLDAASFTSRRGSIYGHYQERYGIPVLRVAEKLGAAGADAEIAAALQVDPGTPLLRIERTAYTFQDKPVEFRIRFVNSAYAAYTNVRGLQD